jgi:hypothetical protein
MLQHVQARTRDLIAQGTPTDRKLYLSGLLVGTELAGAGVHQANSPTVWLVGSTALCALYEAALAVLGVQARFDTAADTSTAGIFSAARAAGVLLSAPLAAPTVPAVPAVPTAALAPASATAAPAAVPAAVATAAASPAIGANNRRPTTAPPSWWG